MKAKKLLALLLATAMTFAMVGCGGDDNAETDAPAEDNQPADDAAEPTEAAPEEDVAEPTEAAPEEDAAATTAASIDFEDGLFGFAYCDTKLAGGLGAAELSVADYNGSKALQAVPGGKSPCIAIPVDQILGDKAGDVATIDVTVGTTSSDGNFYATSGHLYATLGEDNAVNAQPWSVYLESANPKVATFTVPEGSSFGAGNIFAVAMETDNGKAETGAQSTLYIDDITFKDASGNVIEADTSVVVEVASAGADPNLLVLKDAVELEGFAVSAAGWAQAGIDLTDEQRALLVPGSVIEIEYKSDAPVWLVAVGSDENPNPLGTWLRGVEQEGFISNGYVASDSSKVQYTYEQLVEFFGEGWEQYTKTLQCESSADWEVYSVKVGTDSGYRAVGGTELEGFAVSAAGWAQAGIDLTDEQRALLKPGTIIDIEYSSDAPVWLVAVGSDENPNPLGTWLRGVEQEGFISNGAQSEGKVQYTYEQLVEFFGEGWEQYTKTLQCESSADWEVYSVKVGTPYQPSHNVTSLEGFAVSAAGWAQAGIDLTDEQRALLKPGCVINIEYSADAPVWLVAVGSDENPNPLGTWLRGVEQEGFISNGAVLEGKVQYTYEQMVEFFGEGWEQYTKTLQCESSVDWEVYSVSIGMTD